MPYLSVDSPSKSKTFEKFGGEGIDKVIQYTENILPSAFGIEIKPGNRRNS